MNGAPDKYWRVFAMYGNAQQTFRKHHFDKFCGPSVLRTMKEPMVQGAKDVSSVFLSLLVLGLFTSWAWSFFRPGDQHSFRSVAILVLGDIGRSPRMMYHAQSFAENNFETDLIGYGGG
jgi:hypothetical protein